MHPKERKDEPKKIGESFISALTHNTIFMFFLCALATTAIIIIGIHASHNRVVLKIYESFKATQAMEEMAASFHKKLDEGEGKVKPENAELEKSEAKVTEKKKEEKTSAEEKDSATAGKQKAQ